MFGIYRWLLAHLVVLGHLWGGTWFGIGSFAVFSFFLLSGYLMALVLNRTYGFSRRGLARYLGNRALRIYPPYWAILVVAGPLVARFPDLARSVSTMQLPEGAVGWLRNVAILGIHLDRGEQSLVPPIWSVDIELWFYVAMGLLLARSRAIAWLWFAASVAFTVHLVADGQPFNARYSALGGASLPYSLGALLYFHREALQGALSARWHAPVSVAFYLGNATLGRWLWPDVFLHGFYASLASTAWVVVACGSLRPRDLPPVLARWDRTLGDLSYPVFLGHWSMALAVLALGLADGKGPALFLWTLPLVNAFAFGVHALVERPLERWRSRIRPGPGPAAAAPRAHGSA